MGAALPDEFVTWVRSRTMSARARKAVEYMLTHGSVTTADIEAMGYDHPPRAIGDVKDAGIRLRRTMVMVDGRRMARYELVADTTDDDRSARAAIPKQFRDELFARHDHRCAVCGGVFTARELQADHRVPFRIAGDARTFELDDFMPLCASDNRAKSFTCENCPNWTVRDAETCKTCMWGSPEDFLHIATKPHRHMRVAWTNATEVEQYERLSTAARAAGLTPSEYAKRVLDERTSLADDDSEPA